MLLLYAELDAVILFQEVVFVIKRTVIRKDEHCVIEDPVNKDGKQEFGKKVLIKGPSSFFLKPGTLNKQKRNSYQLTVKDMHVK